MERRRGRKLLVAGLGVAAVSYVTACRSKPPDPEVSGNLMAPEPVEALHDAGSPPPEPPPEPPVGNLMPPPEEPPVGNLMPPPRPPEEPAPQKAPGTSKKPGPAPKADPYGIPKDR